ncbi:hypothetical protein N0V87_005332, partial [Didymella glomerata]
MKTVAIVAALAATFNSALADVICNSEVVHYKPRMISAAEKDGLANTIDEVCGNASEASVQKQFQSTVFSRTRTADTFNMETCMAGLHSIVEECLAGKNAGGGSFITDGLTVEVHLDSLNNGARDLGVVEEKITKKPKSSAPKSKPNPEKRIPAKPRPANPTPVKPTPSVAKPDKTPPAGKACPLQPGKGKETGSGKGNGGKKGPAKVVRDLISKLLRRAGSTGKPSSDYGSDCDLEEMADGGAWGVDTWRGWRIPAHGKGPEKAESFAKDNAPTLWRYLQERTLTKPGSKYHAEDVAMLYAIEAGAVKGNTKFPPGSKIAAWGKVGTMPRGDKMPPCTN